MKQIDNIGDVCWHGIFIQIQILIHKQYHEKQILLKNFSNTELRTSAWLYWPDGCTYFTYCKNEMPTWILEIWICLYFIYNECDLFRIKLKTLLEYKHVQLGVIYNVTNVKNSHAQFISVQYVFPLSKFNLNKLIKHRGVINTRSRIGKTDVLDL